MSRPATQPQRRVTGHFGGALGRAHPANLQSAVGAVNSMHRPHKSYRVRRSRASCSPRGPVALAGIESQHTPASVRWTTHGAQITVLCRNRSHMRRPCSA